MELPVLDGLVERVMLSLMMINVGVDSGEEEVFGNVGEGGDGGADVELECGFKSSEEFLNIGHVCGEQKR